MAIQPTLATAESVVDYLKSRNEDSSFGARAKIYKSAGLDARLGNYVGNNSQNINLRKFLSTRDAPKAETPTPTKVADFAPPTTSAVDLQKAFQTGGLQPASGADALKAMTPPATQQPTASAVLDAAKVPPRNDMQANGTYPKPVNFVGDKNSIVDVLKSVGEPSDFASRKKKAESFGITNYTGTSEQNRALIDNIVGGQKQTVATQTDASTKANVGVSANDVIPGVADEDPDESDYVNMWLQSPAGKLFLERQEIQGLSDKAKADALKQELETKYESDKDKLEESLAEAGLTFSGIRGTKVRALANSLAASELEVDRDLAEKLLDSNLDLREAILDGVADLAKEAADNRKEAIQQLNAIGYAVVNGELIPTLAARSAERAERSLEMSERRLELAEASAARAEARFNEEFGEGSKEGFNYVRELMELNPNATRAELKTAALENTRLAATEIDSILDTAGLTSNQAIEVAKSLVATNYESKFFDSGTTELKNAKANAKKVINSSGGVIKVGGRTITLTSDQIKDLENFIDTVNADEVKSTKKLLEKNK